MGAAVFWVSAAQTCAHKQFGVRADDARDAAAAVKAFNKAPDAYTCVH